MRPRLTKSTLEAANNRLEQQVTLNRLALQDAISGSWEAVESATEGKDKIVFRLSRSSAPHGGLLVWEYQIGDNEYPCVTARYLEDVDPGKEVPAFAWQAFDRVKTAAYRIQNQVWM